MTEENIAKNVIDKIKSIGLKPKPKWKFLVKDYLIWIFFVLTIWVGSVATSIIIYMVKNNDWDLYGRLGNIFFIKTLPYFWIIILIIFIFLAYYNFKHTKGGYRHKFYIILLASIIISFLLGSILYASGMGLRMEMRMQKSMPFYHKMFIKGMSEKRRIDLMKPGEGMLVGKVLSDNNTEYFELEDFGGQIWTVFSEMAQVRGPVKIGQDVELMIVGEKISDKEFKAIMIRPYFSPDMMRGRPLMKEKMPYLRMNR